MEAMTTVNFSLTDISGEEIEAVEFIWEEEYKLFIRIMIGITSVVAMFGVTANVINIRTFYLLGLKDGIAVSLFALAINDLCYLFSYVWLRIFSAIIILEEEGYLWMSVHPSVFSTYISTLTVVTSAVGMFAVTYLAVARCLCVSIPLHFKYIFTTKRSIAFNVSFVIISISGYIPIVADTGIQSVFFESHNRSRIVIFLRMGREQVKDAIWLVFDTILPILAEVTLIICVIVMLHKLRQSAKFRQSQTTQQQSKSKEEEDDSDNNIKLKPRDRRVLVQVVLISLIYIVANVPKIFNSLYTQVQPKFTYGKAYQNIYFTMSDIRFVFECLNSTLNFFIYYTFNTAFRKICFKSKLKPQLKA